MNQDLWNKILQFDLNAQPGEYVFSIRLARENNWTRNFTKGAVLEYKKFMYLAADYDLMVSPSPIVDIVWHQHLIFTQSYQEFCNLLGKQIQHIPSTHHKTDFEKFRQAGERTARLYEENFGLQPRAFWECEDMYGSLNLGPATYKIGNTVWIGMLAFLVLIIPFYLLFRPVYVTIGNPGFVLGYLALILATFGFLEFFNRQRLRNITGLFDKESFIFNLLPYELLYLKDQNLSMVINGVVNELIINQTVVANTDNTVELTESEVADSFEQQQVVETIRSLGRPSYPNVIKAVAFKPVFQNMTGAMDGFKSISGNQSLSAICST